MCGADGMVSIAHATSASRTVIWFIQTTTRADMEKDRREFENKISMEAESVHAEIELRTRELLRLRDEKQEEQEQEETR